MANSGIHIKPSKRGTFTAAAKKRGKGVQGFASTVLANKENYSPAMVKKANFARNAAKWKKELGGFLDQELNTPIIEETPIDSGMTPVNAFQDGGKLSEKYEDLKYLKYAEGEPLTGGLFGTIAQGVGGVAGALGAAGAFKKKGSSVGLSSGEVAQTQAGQEIQALGQAQLGNTMPEIQPLPTPSPGKYQDGGELTSAQMDSVFNANRNVPFVNRIYNPDSSLQMQNLTGPGTASSHLMGSYGDYVAPQVVMNQDSTMRRVPQGQVGDQVIGAGNAIQMSSPERARFFAENYKDTDAWRGYQTGMQEFQYGGNLMGLPEYGFGSWLGDNAGGILKGVGGIVSVIPGFGQIAGPALIGAGAATDAIVGKVREKRAGEELETAEQRETAEAERKAKSEERVQRLAAQFDPSKNIDYGATFQLGGDLMQGGQGSVQNPMITGYDGNSNSHQQGIGGVPVDSRGNPSTVSKSSAVGMTEAGEVTWNGYVFSDKLKV